jgi:hypothetical protein
MGIYSISKLIAFGCELTRDIEKHFRKSDFLIDELVKVTQLSGMNVLYTHIRGNQFLNIKKLLIQGDCQSPSDLIRIHLTRYRYQQKTSKTHRRE